MASTWLHALPALRPFVEQQLLSSVYRLPRRVAEEQRAQPAAVLAARGGLCGLPLSKPPGLVVLEELLASVRPAVGPIDTALAAVRERHLRKEVD